MRAPGPNDNLNAVVDGIFSRWGLTARPMMDREQIGQCIGISIGLGALYNENPEAEKAWMWKPRKEFRGTAARMALQGRFEEVLHVVNKERGL